MSWGLGHAECSIEYVLERLDWRGVDGQSRTSGIMDGTGDELSCFNPLQSP